MGKLLFVVILLVIIFAIIIWYNNSALNNAINKKSESLIEVFQIGRDTFDLFVENPSIELINAKEPQIYRYNAGTQLYAKQRVIPFKITPSLIEFSQDKATVKKFLSQYGVNCEVNSVVCVDAPNIPMTLWVRCVQENIFITINEQVADEEYTYRCYTASTFREKFGCINGLLNVKGENIQTDTPVRIYSDYADVPLLTILEAFGAVIDRKTENQIKILFHQEQYSLDVKNFELYNIENPKVNMLHLVDGSSVFIYPKEQDLMVDTATLRGVLSEMGENIVISFDRPNGIVTIE